LKISRNAEIPAFALRNEFKAERRGMSLLHSEMDRENLTARGFHKVLRLSWSIADLAEHDLPLLEDVQRALSLRDGMDLFE
jgi:magnesium chelatase family protein